VIRYTTTTVLLSILVVSCSSDISDPVIKQGYDALELAYITKVKPENASYAGCAYLEMEGRHLARCGISYGSRDLGNKGVWEITSEGGKFVIYTMNGKALTALEKISESEEFRKGHGRPYLDISKANDLFEE